MKQNKYLYLWIVQGRTALRNGGGWEDLGKFEIRREAQEFFKALNASEPKVKHRLLGTRRREVNPDYKGD